MKQRWHRWLGPMVLVAICVIAGGAYAQDNSFQDNLFAGTEKFAKGSKDTTEVNLDKNMLALAGKMGSGLNNMGGFPSKMDSVYVRTYEYDSPGQYKMEDVEKIAARLYGTGWVHIVKERSATESTDVCVRSNDDGGMTELVVIDAEPTELNFVHLKGHISMADMGKMAGNLGAIPNADSLKHRAK